MTRLGGHTPGQAIVEVDTDAGRVVLASDAMHYYEEIERDRPYNLFTDMGDMYRGYDTLRSLGDQPGTTLIAGHDPWVASIFRPARPDCFELTVRVDGS
jgi:glyoxylase-like metal-dependent hydrolase (beta-lactamase superfamily II)